MAKAQEVAIDSGSELVLVWDKFTLGKMTNNAKEILAAIKEKMLGYKAENYSEDNVAEAKKDRASLNALALTLNKERIEREKRWMEPFDPFKAVVEEIKAEIGKASSSIDSVIKSVEQREKDAKKAEIEAYFAGLGQELVPLSAIWVPSWMNKGTSMKAIEEQITLMMAKIRGDLDIIDKLEEPDARLFYLETWDLQGALAKAEALQRNRERLAKAEEAREIPKAPPPSVAPPPAPLPQPSPAPEAPGVLDFTLHFWGTKEQLNGLKAYLFQNKIKYEKLA